MRLHFLSRVLMCGVAVAALSLPVRAEETELDLVTVTINKVKQALSKAFGGVSVADRKDINRDAPATVSEVLAPMPGVATDEAANDPATAINIRGLQDYGRVAVTIDGARQNFQRSGHNANGMFYFEPELMQQVTVTRGPIANVYGSGAIGGVVSFETIDALAFLHEDEKAAMQQKLRFGSNGAGLLTSTTGAIRLGEEGGILGNLTYRDVGKYEDGGGDTIANSGRDIIAGLVKGTFTPGNGQRLDASYMVNSDQFDSGNLTPGATQYANKVRAETVATKYNWDGNGNALFDLTAGAYWTHTNQDQKRLNGAFEGSHQVFDIVTIGTDVYNTSRFATGVVKHTLTAGADIFNDDVKTTDPNGGSAAFFTPSGRRTVGGAFIQDQIEFANWLEVIGAGRFDAFRLEGGDTENSGSRFSPKATVVLKPFAETALDGLNFYGTYAEGYRAPALSETLISGLHPQPGPPFPFLPNPDLKPETAHMLEAGFTGAFNNVITGDDKLSIRASVFQNDVDDYIDGVFDPVGFTYQYQNIGKARLWGVEGEVAYDTGRVFASVAGSITRGDNRMTDEPLLSVPADKVVTTLGVRFLDEKAMAGVRWFAVAEQDRVPAGTPASDAYNLVNLFASYEVSENLSLGFNANNIFDENYRNYLDADNGPGQTFLFTVTGRLGG